MLQLRCPYCGVRDETEFSYHGPAHLPRPAADAGERAFFDHVYLRDNPRGPHEELWQHTGGCRAFVKVQRDTQTHQILGFAWPHETLDVEGEPA